MLDHETIPKLDPARALTIEAFVIAIEAKLQATPSPIPSAAARRIIAGYVGADLAAVRKQKVGQHIRSMTMLGVTASTTAGADLSLLRTWVSMAKDTLATRHHGDAS